MLIDPGSELTLISEQLVKLLKLVRRHSSISIIGIGGTNSGQTRGITSCQLQSIHSSEAISIDAYILSKLMTTLPSFSVADQGWPHLRNLQLADPDFLKPRRIDLIIGADAYGLLIRADVVKGALQTPIAQRTVFGWIVLGPLDCSLTSASYSHCTTIEHQTNELHQLLTKFWVQEEVPSTRTAQLTPDEAECESHFVSTHSRESDGRYVVRLPLKSPASQLGDSLATAQRCLQRLLRRLSANDSYQGLYSDFMKEYEELNHMVRLPGSSDNSSAAYYLPHHGVLREDRASNKLRVVFNGSSHTNNGLSLNDIQHTGAKIQRDISDVILWVRRHRYVFSTDISKMFRQIKVHQDDWNLQRILWVDEELNTVPFQLTTVTYGTRSAPFLAVRVLLQLVEDEGHHFPAAVPLLLKGRYVDDIYGGADQLTDLVTQATQLIGICTAGGFPLAKWQSNQRNFLNCTRDSHSFEDCSAKILGLSWHPCYDLFKFSSAALSYGSKITKRIILSETAQLFDPLGFLSPVTIRAKMLLQELWLERLNWDDSLSPAITHRWTQFREELTGISNIQVPRWLGLTATAATELHGFSDASQLAMGAAVYLKTTSAEFGTQVILVCAKTKVAPLKRLTIPRLELTAALLLTKLMKYTQETLELTQTQVHLWTDSSVTLSWIKSHPSRWKDFVRNRVASIQETLPDGQWHFIPGQENPADCASRGISLSQLKHHNLWWNGPPWVGKSSEHWPTQLIGTDSSSALEERPGHVLTVSTDYHRQPSWDLITRYSSITRLLRITAICFRLVSRLKRIPQSTLAYPLNPGDLENSRLYWVRATQAEYFSSELKIISSGQQLHHTHPLTRLTAFIDQRGLLRVGGRLVNSDLDPDHKHPAILPRDSPLTQLLIADAHERTLHGGTQSTLARLRQEHWIIGGRAPVRSYILRCVRCARQRGIRAQQLMGQLPHSRVTPARAFLNSGVDYAGPITLKAWKGRGSKSHKGWLCIFVCFSTSAVHLEAVTDYSTDGFIAAYRRFISRRGICKTLSSDCGTNFIGADAELKRLFSAATPTLHKITQSLTAGGTTWLFNPPATPHMGGKWEAAVKSVKHHLRRTIGETALTFEEFTTLLNQIEAVLNSRPLEPLSEDSDDLTALTPGHFIIGEPLTTVPEPTLMDVPLNRLSRWQLIQQKLQFFWSRWSAEYLHRQQSISKWHHPSNQLKIGSLVLLTDERFPPSRWPLARITELHPGTDGLTRVVTLKTATTTLQRPIAKIALLPINGTSDSEQLN